MNSFETIELIDHLRWLHKDHIYLELGSYVCTMFYILGPKEYV